MKDRQTILFDYDGTLHDASKIYINAFKTAYQYLMTTHNAPQKQFSDETITQFLGQTPKDMWDQFGKDIPQKARQEASHVLSKAMKESIQQQKAVLYEGALSTLQYLKDKGYHLVFISNCKHYYLEAHQQQFNLDHYFDLLVCSETFPDIQDKDQVLARIKPQLKPPMVIVGDRHHDMQAGRHNNIKTIGCTYGYGSADELAQADMLIDDITQLKAIF